jgi:hypothetical protein
MPTSIPRSLWHSLSRAQLTALAPAAETDECATNPCGTGATCADVAAPGTGYGCSCNSGFTGTDTTDQAADCVATCDSVTCSADTFNKGAGTTGSDATTCCTACTICTTGQTTSGACDGTGASDTATCAGELAHAHLAKLVAFPFEGAAYGPCPGCRNRRMRHQPLRHGRVLRRRGCAGHGIRMLLQLGLHRHRHDRSSG